MAESIDKKYRSISKRSGGGGVEAEVIPEEVPKKKGKKRDKLPHIKGTLMSGEESNDFLPRKKI